MRRLPLRAALAGLVAGALLPAAAGASSIVYVKDDAVWASGPDGGAAVQVTHAGRYWSPSQADDGTIVALDEENRVHRFAPDGTERNPPFLTWLGLNGGSGFAGPYAARVSPDGSTVAYTFIHSQGLDQVTGTSSVEADTAYTPADHAGDPHELGILRNYSNPAWLDAGRTMVFDPGASGLGIGNEDVAVHELGHADATADDDRAHLFNWYSEPGADSPQFGAASRSGDRLAVGEGGVAPTVSLRLSTGARPPAVPQLACRLRDASDGYDNASWSPDGGQLAYQSGGSIFVVDVGDLAGRGCDAVSPPRLLVAGGTSPSWGPAPVPGAAPAPAPAPTAGAPRPGSAPAAPAARPGRRCVVPALRGATLQRARRRLARAGCRLAGHGSRSSGVVRTQRPKAGTKLRAGGRVSVRLGRRAVHRKKR